MNAYKKLVRKYVESFNAADQRALRNLFADDALAFGVLGWGHIDDVIPIWIEYSQGLKVSLDIEDIIVQGDTVAVRYTERGASMAPCFGNPATDRHYEMVAFEWFVIRGDKIYRRWDARDTALQAQQLGWDQPVVRSLFGSSTD